MVIIVIYSDNEHFYEIFSEKNAFQRYPSRASFVCERIMQCGGKHLCLGLGGEEQRLRFCGNSCDVHLPIMVCRLMFDCQVVLKKIRKTNYDLMD